MQSVARRSLLSRTQLHHVSKIFTFDHRVVFFSCFPLKQKTLSWTRRGGGSGRAVLHEAGHGNVYVSWWSPLSAPRKSCTSCNKHSIRPSPRLPLHPLRSRKQPQRRLRQQLCPRLQLRGLTGGETGVFPCWDWIMYCTHCSNVWGRAASARESSLFAESDGEREREGGREGGEELEEHDASSSLEDGGPSSIKLMSHFNVALLLLHTYMYLVKMTNTF